MPDYEKANSGIVPGLIKVGASYDLFKKKIVSEWEQGVQLRIKNLR